MAGMTTRPRLPAAARGYGSRHQALRKAAIAAYRPGQPCARCGLPLYGDPALFDLGHVDGSGKRLYQGLEHRYCSRSAGARLGNALRGLRRHPERGGAAAPGWRPARNW